jgi:uncharacterized protein involved in exopolysaccharide biosynthesis
MYPVQEDEIDLRELLQKIWKGRWIIIFTALFCGVLGGIYAFTATPVYRATTLLMPAGKQEQKGGLSALAGQFGGLASLAGVNLGGGDGSVDKALVMLKSRTFITQFIHEEHLLPILFSKSWNVKTQSWKELKSSWFERLTGNRYENLSKTQKPTMQQAYGSFSKLMTVNNDEKKGTVSLSIDWNDPVLAAQWANKLEKKLDDFIRSKDVTEAEKSIKYLTKQLNKIDAVELQKSIYALIESQSKTVMLANVRDGYVFDVVDKAGVPEHKIKPKKGLIIVLSVILGGFLGIIFCLINNILTNKETVHDSV